MKGFLKNTFACVLGVVIAGLVLPIVGIAVIAGIAAPAGNGEIEKKRIRYSSLTLTEQLRSVPRRTPSHQ